MPYAYVTLPRLKRVLDIQSDDTADDDDLQISAEAASEAFDDMCGRVFQPYVATRYLVADNATWLQLDDLLSVTSLATLTSNSAGSRVYGDVWETTDYDLEPADAPARREPYTAVRANPSGRYAFPSDRQGVAVAGSWGYQRRVTSAGTLGAAIASAGTTSVTMTAGHSVKALQTVEIDSEQLYVTAVSSNTLTVERGMNGTTAATHSNGTAVSAFRYPADVEQATTIMAARLFRRPDAPFGVIGTAELGMARVVNTDPDVAAIVRRYRKTAWIAGV